MKTIPKPVPIDELETPPQVRRMLARLKGVSAEDLKDLEREFKLSFHFEGLLVAVRETASGPEILASGDGEEFFAVLKELRQGKSDRPRLIDPIPLSVLAAQLPRRAAGKAR